MKTIMNIMAAFAVLSCATQPTILDQARALHNSRMQEYAAIRDPDQRARKEYIENYRYEQFLTGLGAVLAQSASQPINSQPIYTPPPPSGATNMWGQPYGAPGSAENPIYVAPMPTLPNPVQPHP